MPNVRLDTPVQYLKGVGPKLAQLLGKLGVQTIFDLIYFFPRDYEDRTKLKPIGDLRPAKLEVICGEIIRVNAQTTRNRFSVIKVELSDRTGSVQAVWFNQPYLTKLFRRGMKLIVSGKVEFSPFDGLQFVPRDFEIDTGANLKIVPRYPLTEGLYPKKVRAITEAALGCLPQIVDFLPVVIRQKLNLIDLLLAITDLHYPKKLTDLDPARRRLIFDEFFLFQLALGLEQQARSKKTGIAFNPDQLKLNKFIGSLPFVLTAAQQRVTAEILADMKQAKVMNRLVQGDVGSGKTIVAAMAAYVAVLAGYQVALMVPTEILAGQHFRQLTELFKPYQVKIGLLTGAINRQKKANKEKPAKVDIFVGTHALIQGQVEFERLGLVIIDEQHRFGVLQRATLVKKGLVPDVLVMTATPIPRSLALTLYGDLDRSIIDELPPGRTPIKTHYVPESKRADAYKFIRERLKAGNQVYIVCPLVEESEKIDLKAAMDEATRLQKEVFPEFKVGLLHGRLKNEQKDQVMRDFAAGQVQVLVSTTVIEVGIDVPNATIIIVEHTERFGLAQLHQLRGRIGRGAKESFCFLMGTTKTEEAKARIKALLDSNDGFQIAEVDFKLRGPGDYIGTRQSGLPMFRLADIITDEAILREAREAALTLIKEDLNCARNIWHSQREKIKGSVTSAALN